VEELLFDKGPIGTMNRTEALDAHARRSREVGAAVPALVRPGLMFKHDKSDYYGKSAASAASR